MTSRLHLELSRSGPGVAWGFRLQGGAEFGTPLSIQRVFNGSPADGVLHRGDVISTVNGSDVSRLTLVQGQDLIKGAGDRLTLGILREGNTASLTQAPVVRSSQPVPVQHQHQHQQYYQQHPQQQYSPPPQQQQQHQHSPMQQFSPKQHFSPQLSPKQNLSHATWQPTIQEVSNNFAYPDEKEVDDEPLKPVKDVKQMFNQLGHGGSPQHSPPIQHHVKPLTNSHHPHPAPHQPHYYQPQQQQQPPASSLSTSATARYQPPSPSIKPAAIADHQVHSLKHPAVYQQRSSYNPLDFQGVNKIAKQPAYRPPGLIQRGAIDTKPLGTGVSYQPPQQRPAANQQFHHERQPAAAVTSSGNLDPLTDFYLHGFNAKNGMPEFPGKTSAANYSGKILPPRSEGNLKTPSGVPVKKKEFKAEQSAVLQILQEEERLKKSGGGGGGGGGRSVRGDSGSRSGGRGDVGSAGGGDGAAYRQVKSGQSNLAHLLEKDQAQMAPYQDGHQQNWQQQTYQQQPQHYQQQPQHYQQQQRYEPQQQQPPQPQENYGYQQQQQQQQPQRHVVRSTVKLIASPNQDHPQQQQQQQQHYSSSNFYEQQAHQQQQQQQQQQPYQQQQNWHSVVTSGMPETDF